MSKPMIESDYQTPDRMSAKMKALIFPDLRGNDVLDVGCDFGYWSKYALENGAARVVGLDRGREVRGAGFVQMDKHYPGEFHNIDLGKQWHEYGKFDVIFMFSLYHHIYQNTGGDHHSIWFWLSRHLKPGGIVLWENPTDIDDVVVQMDVQRQYWNTYNRSHILEAAADFFEYEFIGPALHEPTRWVYKFAFFDYPPRYVEGDIYNGAGGATPAWLANGGRRISEVESILGLRMIPGSLNLITKHDFDWNFGYYRAEVLDPRLTGQWEPRWCRFYPVIYKGVNCYAFRFEGEQYSNNFVELIADRRLRDGNGSRP